MNDKTKNQQPSKSRDNKVNLIKNNQNLKMEIADLNQKIETLTKEKNELKTQMDKNKNNNKDENNDNDDKNEEEIDILESVGMKSIYSQLSHLVYYSHQNNIANSLTWHSNGLQHQKTMHIGKNLTVNGEE